MDYKRTQQAVILDLLMEAGNTGVNSFDLDYKYHIKQAPTRIYELQKKGHRITTIKQKNRSVNYILENEIKQETQYRWEFEGNIARKIYDTR